METLTDRGEQIMSAAIRLLSEGGIAALTIKNLANSVGVTEPALYRHFDSKLDILVAILDRLEANMNRLFEQSMSRARSAPVRVGGSHHGYGGRAHTDSVALEERPGRVPSRRPGKGFGPNHYGLVALSGNPLASQRIRLRSGERGSGALEIVAANYSRSGNIKRLILKGKTMNVRKTLLVLVSVGIGMVIGSRANAHCDTMDGPVIKDAQAALAGEDVTKVLKWVLPKDEREIKDLFRQVLKVRKQGEPAKSMAEKYFFESLVRIHRAGEGAPYTGLKPAGKVEPIIAASDKALAQKSIDELVEKITQRVEHEIRRRFQTTLENKKHLDRSVEAGRAYVRAYVEFTHYMEALHKTIAATAHGHGSSSPEASSQNDKASAHDHEH